MLSKKAFSFYVLSTSFLRNGYYETGGLHTLHIRGNIWGEYILAKSGIIIRFCCGCPEGKKIL